MSLAKSLLTALLLASVVLAGCTDSDDGGAHGFVIKSTPADPVTGAYVFEATVSGDEYIWDMGDGRAAQSGKSVEYIYGFTDGVIKPKLTVVSGGEETTYASRTLTLGTGQNAEPQLVMTADWAWVTVGESITFSGASSTDPDGDPLLFSWFCQRVSDIGIVPAGGTHSHGGGVSGGGFASGSAITIPSHFLNGTDVPAAEADLGNDLCAALTATSGSFSEDATVTGTFAERGIYKVSMLARDPKSPSKPGALTVFVTEPSEPRLEGPVTYDFDGTFDFGVPASGDGLLAQLEQGSHIAEHRFNVRYPMTAFDLDFEFDEGPSTQNVVTYHIVKPGGSLKQTEESSEDINRDDSYLDHAPSDYTLRVYGRQGAQLSYTASITITYESDPAKIFDDPVAH